MGSPQPDQDRVIIHVDADSFYAQCEELRNPYLKGRPLGRVGRELVSSLDYVRWTPYSLRRIFVFFPHRRHSKVLGGDMQLCGTGVWREKAHGHPGSTAALPTHHTCQA